MYYSIYSIPQSERSGCEYEIGAFNCIANALYDFKTDTLTKRLCKQHMEEYRQILENNGFVCLDESVINPSSDEEWVI